MPDLIRVLQLALMDRDFTDEDYEMLMALDRNGPANARPVSQEALEELPRFTHHVKVRSLLTRPRLAFCRLAHGVSRHCCSRCRLCGQHHCASYRSMQSNRMVGWLRIYFAVCSDNVT